MKSNRRNFLKQSGLTAAGITIVPSLTVSGLGHKAPSDKMNIAGVGIGGKGYPNLKAMSQENIVALCDVDWKYSDKTFKEFPNAKRFWDWRKAGLLRPDADGSRR
jgi:hypothetical protein